VTSFFSTFLCKQTKQKKKNIYIYIYTKENKIYMKGKIENPKGQSTQKESKRKSMREPASLKIPKVGLGKN